MKTWSSRYGDGLSESERFYAAPPNLILFNVQISDNDEGKTFDLTVTCTYYPYAWINKGLFYKYINNTGEPIKCVNNYNIFVCTLEIWYQFAQRGTEQELSVHLAY